MIISSLAYLTMAATTVSRAILDGIELVRIIVYLDAVISTPSCEMVIICDPAQFAM